VTAMKGVLLAAPFLLAASAAGADQLQFKIDVGGGTSYAAFAQVRVLNDENRQVFGGYADRYGRVNVPIPPGRYRAVVVTHGQTKMKSIELTGARGLRLVTLD
jgi:hypothetical protein